jgi:hypothetical protein
MFYNTLIMRVSNGVRALVVAGGILASGAGIAEMMHDAPSRPASEQPQMMLERGLPDTKSHSGEMILVLGGLVATVCGGISLTHPEYPDPQPYVPQKA